MSINTSTPAWQHLKKDDVAIVQKLVVAHSRKVLSAISPLSKEDAELIWNFRLMEKDLFIRLQDLKGNEFHNIHHTIAVHRRLWMIFEWLKEENRLTPRKMILMGRGALSHDDGHSGNTYRQNVVIWSDESNEEWAVKLLERDIINNNVHISPDDMTFMKNIIYWTTFAQWEGFLKKDDPRYRSYKADSTEQKLLVFADIWWAGIDGWTQWRNESMEVILESKQYPKDLQEWILTRRMFLKYVRNIYEDLQDQFTPEFQKKVLERFENCTKNIDEIEKNPFTEEAIQIREMLQI